MNEIDFNYNGTKTVIQCKKNDKMKEIYKKFATKTGADISSLYFLYGGDSKLNEELTVDQIASADDKIRKSMTIIVNQQKKMKILLLQLLNRKK